MDTEPRRTISEDTWKQLATRLDVELAALKAVAEVESSGSGFLPAPDRRPKVLFEGHVFHRLTAGRHSLTHPAISHPVWDRSRYARSLAGEWKRLDTAATLDPAAAMQSASWGAFQIMGFNHNLCSCKDVYEFVHKMSESHEKQLELMYYFMNTSGCLKNLKEIGRAHV